MTVQDSRLVSTQAEGVVQLHFLVLAPMVHMLQQVTKQTHYKEQGGNQNEKTKRNKND